MKHCNDFRYDLEIGKQSENELSLILQDTTIEVKDDSKHSAKTGNVFIEYESRNKPSGISTTQATHWAIKTSSNTFVIICTERLKEIARKYIGTDRDVLGGDNNTSKGILVPREELL